MANCDIIPLRKWKIDPAGMLPSGIGVRNFGSSFLSKVQSDVPQKYKTGLPKNAKFLPRIVDPELDLRLRAVGATVIVGPKWHKKP